MYVEKGGAMCHCLCLFKSYQLFLRGGRGCLYCRAVAVCDAVAGPVSKKKMLPARWLLHIDGVFTLPMHAETIIMFWARYVVFSGTFF